ncbi:MAG: hypothetical protein UU80_C0005G0012 [candidate division WWE3 bacterium GW2011_GWA1_41_8]|uniref:Uncharacterized protein n=2 Tax=Katanobacteria TaxID=422282 RepID=A0A0G0XDU4_UNCKA|nr:MAG: hypothetical protein UU72_C0020G0002 [candidate division WWE3 bacterium GW2011_GWB1_41_6]KKS22567.1 MAG: hypothetical protein UU80_C0005G0012 [candidate division WWE3 bacterium GW2011_GWA1_41_8]
MCSTCGCWNDRGKFEEKYEDDDSTYDPRDSRGWDEQDSKDYSEWEGEQDGNDTEESYGDIKETWHVARDDYQASGSPYGELPGRK